MQPNRNVLRFIKENKNEIFGRKINERTYGPYDLIIHTKLGQFNTQRTFGRSYEIAEAISIVLEDIIKSSTKDDPNFIQFIGGQNVINQIEYLILQPETSIIPDTGSSPFLPVVYQNK